MSTVTEAKGKRTKARTSRGMTGTSRTAALKLRATENFDTDPKVAIYRTVRGRKATASAVLGFRDVYRMDPIERILVVQHGIEAENFTNVAQSMRLSKERVAAILGMGASTLDRKIQTKKLLTTDQSERLVATAKLIGQVQTMVEESGDPKGFDAAQWFATWLDKPLSALGGHKPAEIMNTAEGRELVSKLLSTAQSGAYV